MGQTSGGGHGGRPRWPLGVGQPWFGMPYLYSEARIPAAHQARAYPMALPRQWGVGVMMVPAMDCYEPCQTNWGSHAFTHVADHVRRVGDGVPDRFDTGEGSTCYIPVPVTWRSLTINRNDDVYQHEGAFTREWALDVLHDLARVPTVLWDFVVDDTGMGHTNASLICDPADQGEHPLVNLQGRICWSHVIWPLSHDEWRLLLKARRAMDGVRTWGDDGCECNRDHDEVMMAYKEAFPERWEAAMAEMKKHLDDKATPKVIEAIADAWFYEHLGGDAEDWWARVYHQDSWLTTGQMFEKTMHGPQIKLLLGELMRSTERIDRKIRELVAKEGDPQWAFSWDSRFCWPE